MAQRTGLEPATPGVTGRYSNQLNYQSIFSYDPYGSFTCAALVGDDGIEPPTLCL